MLTYLTSKFRIMEDRKGILTPEQEKTLDKLIQFNSALAESMDGAAISLLDNQVIDRFKDDLAEKYPGALDEFVYPIVDALFAGLESIVE